MFVPEALLKIDLRALVEKAINKWSETQPLGFTRPLVEECGDFITAEMNAKGLRLLQAGDPYFNDKATAQQFRDCVFAALDHWLVRAEISGEPIADQKTHDLCASSVDIAPFSALSALGAFKMPPVDPYYAFDENWGPGQTTGALPGTAASDETAPLLRGDARPKRRLPAWLQMLLAMILADRRQVALRLYSVVLLILFLVWLFGFSGLIR